MSPADPPPEGPALDLLREHLSGKRSSERVAFPRPVRLSGAAGSIDASGVDLSRMGCLLRVEAADLGADSETPTVLEWVERHLGAGAVVSLPAADPGSPPVSAEAEVVRASLTGGARGGLLIGLRFRRPLAADAVARLGVTLAVDAPAPTLRPFLSAAPWQALLYGDQGSTAGPACAGRLAAASEAGRVVLRIAGAASVDRVSTLLRGGAVRVRAFGRGREPIEEAAEVLAVRTASGGRAVEVELSLRRALPAPLAGELAAPP